MNNKFPLQGERILLTGSKVTRKINDFIESLGGEAWHYPLIQTAEIMSEMDEALLKKSQQVDWLIFTSQNAVEAFHQKIQRYGLQPSQWSPKIAAVGDKTEQALLSNGFLVSFKPTLFSADTMVKEMSDVITAQDHCLFIRGSLAKATIIDGLKGNVDTWTIYETIQTTKHIPALIEQLTESTNCTVVFASPSAVEMYVEHILPARGWASIHIAAIGHITEKALQQAGATDILMPQTYTMQAVVEEIANRKELDQ